MTTEPARYILKLACPDRLGIVAAVSGFLAQQDCNVTESAQFNDPTTGQIFLRTVFTAGATPAPIQQRIHAEISIIAGMDEVKKILATVGSDLIPQGPEVFVPLFKDEVVQWAKVAKEAGIQPE